jgi:hypothetical protein
MNKHLINKMGFVSTDVFFAAIAGIVIGAVAFAGLVGFGSKKGYSQQGMDFLLSLLFRYDYYRARMASLNGAQTNPMYRDSNLRGANPFYDGHEL